MKKRGFTLIELLAVIVVLAVIALITTPVILGVIEKAKKGAFKNSVYGLIESTNIYIAENLDAGNISFICNGKDCIMEDGNKLSFKGNVPKSGTIKAEEQHIEVEYITDGTYCAYGTLEDLIIDKGCANIDITKPEIDESKLLISSTTSSISIRILEGFAIDPESGIKEYRVTLNGETKTLKEIGSLTFEGLEKNKSYSIKIEVENGKGLIAEVEKEGSTLDFENPTITLTNTPTTAVNGYLKNQVAKVTYNSTNISSPQYFIKTTRVGTSSVAVTKTCGTGTMPSTCTSVTSTTTLSANTWYQVSGNVNVTYNKAASTTATIYAITYDGTNYSGASTGTISKIDTIGPTNVTITPVALTGIKPRISISVGATDSDSGIKKYVIYYGNSSTTLTSTKEITSTAVTLDVTAGANYYFKVRAYDNLDNYTDSSVSSPVKACSYNTNYYSSWTTYSSKLTTYSSPYTWSHYSLTSQFRIESSYIGSSVGSFVVGLNDLCFCGFNSPFCTATSRTTICRSYVAGGCDDGTVYSYAVTSSCKYSTSVSTYFLTFSSTTYFSSLTTYSSSTTCK